MISQGLHRRPDNVLSALRALYRPWFCILHQWLVYSSFRSLPVWTPTSTFLTFPLSPLFCLNAHIHFKNFLLLPLQHSWVSPKHNTVTLFDMMFRLSLVFVHWIVITFLFLDLELLFPNIMFLLCSGMTSLCYLYKPGSFITMFTYCLFSWGLHAGNTTC